MTPDHAPSTSPMPDPGSITVVPIGGDIDPNTNESSARYAEKFSATS